MIEEVENSRAIERALAPSEWYRITATGIEFIRDPSIEEYLDFVGRVAFVDKSLWWVWADILNKGEHLFGEMYAQALDESGYKMPTLANAKSVGKKIPRFRLDPATGELVPFRRPADQVSPSVHAVLAKMSEGPEDHAGHARVEAWLQFVEEYHVSEKKLRRLTKALPMPTLEPSTDVGREALEWAGLLKPALTDGGKEVFGKATVRPTAVGRALLARLGEPPDEVRTPYGTVPTDILPRGVVDRVDEEGRLTLPRETAEIVEEAMAAKDREIEDHRWRITDLLTCRRALWARAWAKERKRRRAAENALVLMTAERDALASELEVR